MLDLFILSIGEVDLLSVKSTCEGNEVAIDKFLAICREILNHMPRNPGPSAENATKSSAICQDCHGPSDENANKSSAICRDCQELHSKYACQECQVFLGWPWLQAYSTAWAADKFKNRICQGQPRPCRLIHCKGGWIYLQLKLILV